MKRSLIPLILILVIGAGAFFVYKKVTPPQITTSVPFAQLSPPEKKRRRVEAQKLTDQVEKVTREIKNGTKQTFHIEASEEQLNTLLQERLDTSKFPVRDLNVGLTPGELAMQGRVLYQGIDATATLTGDVSVKDGKLDFQAADLKLQGFSVGSLRRRAEKEITRALNKWSEKMPGRLENVSIEDKKITIEGTTTR
jgi:hypothetical protein